MYLYVRAKPCGSGCPQIFFNLQYFIFCLSFLYFRFSLCNYCMCLAVIEITSRHSFQARRVYENSSVHSKLANLKVFLCVNVYY